MLSYVYMKKGGSECVYNIKFCMQIILHCYNFIHKFTSSGTITAHILVCSVLKKVW